MAHKFAQLGHVFTLRFNFAGELMLVPAGEVDFRNFQENGTLPNGTHHDRLTSPRNIPVMGRAYGYNGDQYLTFSHQGVTGTFMGKLVFEDQNHLLVIGGISDDDDTTNFRDRDKAAPFDQQEQTIIITKP